MRWPIARPSLWFRRVWSWNCRRVFPVLLPVADDGSSDNSTNASSACCAASNERVVVGELKEVAKLVRKVRSGDKRTRIRVLWGCARWSRSQLLGELAQHEWGMCPGQPADLRAEPLQLWEEAWQGRAVIAPPNEMCGMETPRLFPGVSSADAAEHRARLREQVMEQQQAAERRGEW